MTWYLQHAKTGRVLMRTNTSRAFFGASRIRAVADLFLKKLANAR